ncbi:hypothetical protein GE300_02860 [Rhodobacteraceae bacterium 2CG4]|uniref:Lipoprotein n=1 Tax=Halovulum marinum TaxID=2662447 RepID=A0A6L5YX65_9RHOB|nr:hypothetical protein [Halovulum marinum]MSU88559.1 hypothetical protein [Halovulum marinum]
MGLGRLIAPVLMLMALAGCAVEVGAPAEEIARARFVPADAPYVAVVSMVAYRDGRAAHTALFINASERVIYDPAGTFQHPAMPERGDINYGATDRMIDYYERYHARKSHFVHVQKIPVSREVAEATLRRAQAQGPSPKSFCTVDTIAVLNGVDGLPSFRSSFFPEQLRTQVARLPNVIDRYVYEDDTEKALPPEALRPAR